MLRQPLGNGNVSHHGIYSNTISCLNLLHEQLLILKQEAASEVREVHKYCMQVYERTVK